jgi:chorismate mutase
MSKQSIIPKQEPAITILNPEFKPDVAKPARLEKIAAKKQFDSGLWIKNNLEAVIQLLKKDNKDFSNLFETNLAAVNAPVKDMSLESNKRDTLAHIIVDKIVTPFLASLKEVNPDIANFYASGKSKSFNKAKADLLEAAKPVYLNSLDRHTHFGSRFSWAPNIEPSLTALEQAAKKFVTTKHVDNDRQDYGRVQLSKGLSAEDGTKIHLTNPLKAAEKDTPIAIAHNDKVITTQYTQSVEVIAERQRIAAEIAAEKAEHARIVSLSKPVFKEAAKAATEAAHLKSFAAKVRNEKPASKKAVFTSQHDAISGIIAAHKNKADGTNAFHEVSSALARMADASQGNPVVDSAKRTYAQAVSGKASSADAINSR